MSHAPALIALDWGTSNLRASLLGEGGRLIERRAAPGGVMAVPERRFEPALRALCGDWLDTLGCPVIASGMIGSRQGWQEAPYVECPATLAQAAARLTRVPLQGGGTLHIVPGLCCVGADGVDDVMRGEETQLWGADLSAGRCAVLPGTHAKWAWMGEGGGVERFQTWLTGELFGLWTRHGILGRLMEFGHESPDDYARGVRLGLAEHANAHHVVFAARTAGLMGRIAPRGLPDYLSGLLVGIEIGSALGTAQRGAGDPDSPLVLIGDDDLCRRYETALSLAGRRSVRAGEEVTLRGQWRVACAAGLVKG
jgi:2-dehydro-3-deoxygalactonokinase